MTPQLQVTDPVLAGVLQAVSRTTDYFLRTQHEPGYWWAELTADTTLESDYVLLQLWLHPPVNGVWNPPTRPQINRAVESILARQLPDGGFNIYPQGPADVSATVKAYFALKLAGLNYHDQRLARARDRILALGGIQAANSYVKINLSLFDLYPREHTPSIPPEMVLAGKLIYQMSSWTRAIVIPLSIIHASNPHRAVPSGFNVFSSKIVAVFVPPLLVNPRPRSEAKAAPCTIFVSSISPTITMTSMVILMWRGKFPGRRLQATARQLRP